MTLLLGMALVGQVGPAVSPTPFQPSYLAPPQVLYGGCAAPSLEIPPLGAGGVAGCCSPSAPGQSIEWAPPVCDGVEPPACLMPASQYYDPFSNQFAYGNIGVQPYKFGWASYDDVTWMPTAQARGTTGSFQDVDWNSSFRYARMINGSLVFSWTPTWNASFWTGPTGVPLPGQVNQITSDLQLASATAGPWNFQIGFTPQVNSDFERRLDSNAYMFDGRAVLFYQTSPNWRWAFGFAYWNRVIDRFIPYGGVVWAPNDLWEFRIFFPKTRISRYCGHTPNGPVWVYATAEYYAQAYQIDLENAVGTKTRGEMRDYRVMLGVETQRPWFGAFAEFGAIFDRQFYFRDAAYNFGVNPGLIARVGLTF